MVQEKKGKLRKIKTGKVEERGKRREKKGEDGSMDGYWAKKKREQLMEKKVVSEGGGLRKSGLCENICPCWSMYIISKL